MKNVARLILLGMAGASLASASAQSPAVLNPGAELYSDVPAAPGEWFHALHWGNAGSSLSDPDFYHEDGSGGGDLPETPVALVNAFDGKGVLAFTAARTDGSNRREYLVGQLDAPLDPGQRYQLSFAITNGELTPFSQAGAAVSGLGLVMTDEAPLQTGSLPLELDPIFQLNAPFYDREWREVIFTFTATGAWEYFTIGVFAGDSEVDFELVEGASPQLAYYFVDSFALQDAPVGSQDMVEVSEPSSPVAEVVPEAAVVPWFVPNAFSPNGDGDNDLFQPVLNAVKLKRFEVFNRWGESLYSPQNQSEMAWDGRDSKGKDMPFGVYVWKLQMELESGEQTEKSGMLNLIR